MISVLKYKVYLVSVFEQLIYYRDFMETMDEHIQLTGIVIQHVYIARTHIMSSLMNDMRSKSLSLDDTY